MQKAIRQDLGGWGGERRGSGTRCWRREREEASRSDSGRRGKDGVMRLDCESSLYCSFKIRQTAFFRKANTNSPYSGILQIRLRLIAGIPMPRLSQGSCLLNSCGYSCTLKQTHYNINTQNTGITQVIQQVASF